jgi:hypothetical protein
VHEACPPHSSAGIVAKITASTVAQYLAALPADRRAALSAVRRVINENLPDGYEEGMQFGMIGWYVPLSMYPAGYGETPKVPLSFVALASQKTGMVLHFLCFYGHPTLSPCFISEWSDWEERHRRQSRKVAVSGVGRGANQYKKSGKKVDMDGLAAPGSAKRLGGRCIKQTSSCLPLRFVFTSRVTASLWQPLPKTHGGTRVCPRRHGSP